jgi:hypothetical protein
MTARRDRNNVVVKVETDQGRLLKQEIPEGSSSSGSGTGTATIKPGLYRGVVSAYNDATSVATVVALDGVSRQMLNYSGFVLPANARVMYAAYSATDYAVIGYDPQYDWNL